MNFFTNILSVLFLMASISHASDSDIRINLPYPAASCSGAIDANKVGYNLSSVKSNVENGSLNINLLFGYFICAETDGKFSWKSQVIGEPTRIKVISEKSDSYAWKKVTSANLRLLNEGLTQILDDVSLLTISSKSEVVFSISLLELLGEEKYSELETKGSVDFSAKINLQTKSIYEFENGDKLEGGYSKSGIYVVAGSIFKNNSSYSVIFQ